MAKEKLGALNVGRAPWRAMGKRSTTCARRSNGPSLPSVAIGVALTAEETALFVSAYEIPIFQGPAPPRFQMAF